jgi:ubiquinone/menaquinone biosynthesis C-methylase UbiE
MIAEESHRVRIRDVMKAYDKIAKSYGGYRRAEWSLITKFKEGAGKVLDIGCGNQVRGDFGVDISFEMLKRSEGIGHVVQGNAADLPIKSDSFSKVIMIAVMHHVPHSSRGKVIKELSRVMKVNGRALVTVWAKEHQRFMQEVVIGAVARVNWGDVARYYYLYSLDELKQVSQQYDLKAIESGRFGDNFYVILKKVKEK